MNWVLSWGTNREFDRLYFIDFTHISLTSAEILYACTDTSDTSTIFYTFPERYMLLGTAIGMNFFVEEDGALVQKSSEDYDFIGGGFVSKMKDGEVEYYLRFKFTRKAQEESKIFAPELWKKEEEYMEFYNRLIGLD